MRGNVFLLAYSVPFTSIGMRMDYGFIMLFAATAFVVTSNAAPYPGAQRPNVTSWPGSEVCTMGVVAKTDCFCFCPECILSLEAKVCWAGEMCRRKPSGVKQVRFNNVAWQYIV